MRPSIQELNANFWAEERAEQEKIARAELKSINKILKAQERYKKTHPSVVINANAKPTYEPKGWATKSKTELSKEPKPSKKRGKYRPRQYHNDTNFQLTAIEILTKKGLYKPFFERKIFLITHKDPKRQAQAQAIAEHFNKKLKKIWSAME